MPVGLMAGIAGLGGLAVNAWNAYQQWKNTEYLKKQQIETWKREDTAQQRAVNDLRAAGMSPVLAAGHGSPVSTPVRTEAPQLKLTPADIAGQALSLMKMKADISRTNAEARVSNVQADIAEQTKVLQLERAKIELDILESKGVISYQEAKNMARIIDQQFMIDTQKLYLLEQQHGAAEWNLERSKYFGVRTNDSNKYLQLGEFLFGSGVLGDLRDRIQDTINSVQERE